VTFLESSHRIAILAENLSAHPGVVVVHLANIKGVASTNGGTGLIRTDFISFKNSTIYLKDV